ncbi:AraC family transcriptional regulator [Paenibacillus sp. FSL W8-0439]|uniref:AraC family transcriptional regulator n=1 Tax=Paenibacillus sp. FSL W8-0439 TaxID=2921716 RepID=UPI0030F97347
MKADTMPVDRTLFVNIQHGHPEFPIQYYVDELYTFLDRRVPLHWHFEPQFYVAMGGIVRVQIGSHTVTLNVGDGIFINGNTLHGFEQINEMDMCECPNIIFSAELIAPHSSIMFQKYMKPILTDQNLPYIIFTSDIPWNNGILKKLFSIFDLLQQYGAESSFGPFPKLNFETCNPHESCFELQVQCLLNQIWQTIVLNFEEIPKLKLDKRDLQYQVRLQHMVSYIEFNYKKTITLLDISTSANISKSEASRVFQSYMHCSPIEFLLRHRIEAAKRLLSMTDYSIQDISMECGFNNTSYFNKVFKKKVGMTPKQYRTI